MSRSSYLLTAIWHKPMQLSHDLSLYRAMEFQRFLPECFGLQSNRMDDQKPFLRPRGPLEPPLEYPHPQQSSSPSRHALKRRLPTNTATFIPCNLDVISGSSSMADKRKANSLASRRFRDRKRKELELLQQRFKAQEDQISLLIQQRDHYRSERDKLRDHLSRLKCPIQLPLRTSSPQQLKSPI